MSGQVEITFNRRSPSSEPPSGLVRQTSNFLNAKVPPKHLVIFEVFLRQGDDSRVALPELSALICTGKGEAVAYAIFNLQDRGTMFVTTGDRVYEGMIVGENSRDNDLDINVLKGKKLTNVRASGADEAVVLVPPRKMSLEDMMAYINDDELVEVTPKSLRLRKKFLSPTDREIAKKKANKEREAGAA